MMMMTSSRGKMYRMFLQVVFWLFEQYRSMNVLKKSRKFLLEILSILFYWIELMNTTKILKFLCDATPPIMPPRLFLSFSILCIIFGELWNFFIAITLEMLHQEMSEFNCIINQINKKKIQTLNFGNLKKSPLKFDIYWKTVLCFFLCAVLVTG